MANHVINIVRINADEGRIKVIQEFMAAREKWPDTDDEPLTFDFTRLIPMPDKFATRESWSRLHWGTKWNAYDDALTRDGFVFFTAWATPVPVFLALSKRFPGLRFTVEYADQDTGHNCGVIAYLDGQVVRRENREGDRAFAHRVWGDTQSAA